MDLDGDGEPEWVLESPQARAVFSTRDGGRWLEFVWKDTGANFLPEQGALAGHGRRRGHDGQDGLEFTRRIVEAHGPAGWCRADHRAEAPAADETVQGSKRDGVTLKVARESPTRAVYSLSAEETRP